MYVRRSRSSIHRLIMLCGDTLFAMCYAEAIDLTYTNDSSGNDTPMSCRMNSSVGSTSHADLQFFASLIMCWMDRIKNRKSTVLNGRRRHSLQQIPPRRRKPLLSLWRPFVSGMFPDRCRRWSIRRRLVRCQTEASRAGYVGSWVAVRWHLK